MLYHADDACHEMHVQRSNALLAEYRKAAEQHRSTLDSMRLKLQALDAQAFERAASDAVKVREQVGGTKKKEKEYIYPLAHEEYLFPSEQSDCPIL